MRANSFIYKSKNNFILNSSKYSIFFTIIFFLSFISVYNINIKIFFSEIKLVIRGNNTQYILSKEFDFEPDQVLVNGILKSSCNKTCYLDKDLNNITIIFNNNLESCSNMFKNLNNIIGYFASYTYGFHV